MSQDVNVNLKEDKGRDWGGWVKFGLSAVFIPLFMLCLNDKYATAQKDRELAVNAAQKEKELSLKYFELAVDILNTDADKTIPAVRKWAYNYFLENSGSNEDLKNAEEELLNKPIIKSSQPRIAPNSLYLSPADDGKGGFIITGSNDTSFDYTVNSLVFSSIKFPSCSAQTSLGFSFNGQSSLRSLPVDYDRLLDCISKNDAEFTELKLREISREPIQLSEGYKVQEVRCTAFTSFFNRDNPLFIEYDAVYCGSH
ncbi:hypothetical protein [Agarivorans sp. QJM3NY_33]